MKSSPRLMVRPRFLLICSNKPCVKVYRASFQLLFCASDVSIETFHTEWKTDYKRLERVHSYIQW